MNTNNTKDNIKISAGASLGGSLAVISSKSELHRLIFCACLSDAGSIIRYNSQLSKDIEATISCFRSLGAEIFVSDGEIDIRKPLDRERAASLKEPEIFCNESGSTARFILPLLSVICKNGAVMTGAGKLPTRPFSDLCDSLSAHGAKYSSVTMPIKIQKCACPEGTFEISGNISSQYLSGLLFILPLCKNAKIRLTTPLESAGYVDMTIEAMKKFGITVTEKDGEYTSCGSYTAPREVLYAGGDWSNAAFFLCAAKDSKKVTLTGIDPDSLQPDRAVINILEKSGFEVEKGDMCVSVRRTSATKPFDIDAGETPDLVPILCVLAATIKGKSIIRNIRRLRFKESDRVESACSLISSLGGKICADNENIYIDGTGSLHGGSVDSFNDHRIAMSAAAAASFCENHVEIIGAGAVTKSYPGFYAALAALSEETK